MNKKVDLKNFVDAFNLEIISGEKHLDNIIEIYGLNRAGLELAGYFEKGSNNHRLILMSNKESSFVMQFSEEQRRQKYEKLINKKMPGIIITKKFKDDILIQVAKENDFPLLRSDNPSTSELARQILEFQDEYFAPSVEVHASLVNVYGKGVLIQGVSGIGKSEITLDLIKQNHLFIGDDRIILMKKSNKIYGKSHPIIFNMVEVRGIGIINIAETHGYRVIMEETSVDLVIELVSFEKGSVDDYERIGNSFEKFKILDDEIPYMKIPVSSGRNIANIIETAVSQLKIIKSGNYVKPIDVLTERLDLFKEEGN